MMTQPAADATVSSISALQSQLATWESAGPTSSKIVDLEDGNYGSVSLLNYAFTNTVTVRSQDYDNLGARFTYLDVSGCENLKIQFIDINRSGGGGLGAGSNLVKVENADTVGFEYCNIQPDETADTGDGTNVNVVSYGVRIYSTSPNCYINHCVIQQGCAKGVYVLGDNFTATGVVFNEISGDEFHFSSSDGASVIDCWGSRQKNPASGEHCDFVQTATFPNTNFTMRGCVVMKANTSDLKTHTGLLASHGFTGGLIEQNIICTNTINGLSVDADVGGTTDNNIARYNTCLYVTDDLQPTTLNGTFTCRVLIEGTNVDAHHNVMALADGETAGGTGSIGIEVGATKETRDYTDQEIYYGGPIISSPATPFAGIAPKDGQATHWDAGSPTGAATRFKEILVDGLHPGNQPGPVAAFWRALYDPENEIGSTPKNLARRTLASITVA